MCLAVLIVAVAIKMTDEKFDVKNHQIPKKE